MGGRVTANALELFICTRDSLGIALDHSGMCSCSIWASIYSTGRGVFHRLVLVVAVLLAEGVWYEEGGVNKGLKCAPAA